MAARSCPVPSRGKPVTVQDMFEAVGKHSVGDDVRRGPRRGWSRSLPVRRPAPAAPSSPPTPWRRCPRPSASRCRIRPARRRPTKCATRFCMTAGEKVMELIAKQHPPARHRHPQGAGERRGRGRRRRGGSTNAGAASAGDRARMRHRVRPVRRRRNLQKDTLCRRFETGWPLCRQRHVRGWRRSAA